MNRTKKFPKLMRQFCVLHWGGDHNKEPFSVSDIIPTKNNRTDFAYHNRRLFLYVRFLGLNIFKIYIRKYNYF